MTLTLDTSSTDTRESIDSGIDAIRDRLRAVGLGGRRCFIEGIGWLDGGSGGTFGTLSPPNRPDTNRPDTNRPDTFVRQKVLTHWDATIGNALKYRQQARELETHVDGVVRRISDSYEELTFLRRMADHFHYCGADRDVVVVAQGLLDEACEIVGAEAMFFITPREEQGSFKIEAHAGDVRLATLTMSWLAQTAGTRLWDGSIVQNHPPAAVCAPVDGPGLTGCLLVPVLNSQLKVGWLLCCNKLDTGFAFETCARQQDQQVSEREFGTHEATLLESVAAVLAAHAGNCALFAERDELLLDVIRALTGSLDARDPYTRGHSDRVAKIAAALARQLELPAEQCRAIHVTGLLHDIGKIAVPDEVLLKPGRLTEAEFAEIKKHPEAGYRILEPIKPLAHTLQGVLHHHETLDGRGYPQGLVGEAIPLDARILAVADAYDAMTSDRPYRSGMPHEKAESILRDGAGTQWDGGVVAALFASVTEIRALCLRTGDSAPASTIGGEQ